MGGIFKKLSPVAMIAGSGGSDAPAAPKQVKGGGIETIIKGQDELKKKNKQRDDTLLGGAGERKVGL
jgi:hypothetical protein